MPLDLAIILPVYNEQASVRKVVLEWFQEIENWTENFTFLCLNDGSTDDTLKILNRLRDQLGPRLEILTHANRGHGQTCLAGYRLACERQIHHILQIDSDGQCDPQYFFRFWRLREKFDVIYGVRTRRDDGWRRVLASLILKTVLLATQRVHCADANVPYRLIRTEKLLPILEKIPSDFFLANIAFAVLLKKSRWTHHHIPIRFRERYGGEPSVKLGKFSEKAVELVTQLSKIKI
ncbi:MAG: glycosyltransferase family 2 protein [Verrucomicrobia bacterium]|nr:glycosyltransferase family 2 protein [Verrucomicrobiota bacterium]